MTAGSLAAYQIALLAQAGRQFVADGVLHGERDEDEGTAGLLVAFDGLLDFGCSFGTNDATTKKDLVRFLAERIAQQFTEVLIAPELDDEARAELVDEPYKLELIGLKGSAADAAEGAGAEVGAGEPLLRLPLTIVSIPTSAYEAAQIQASDVVDQAPIGLLGHVLVELPVDAEPAHLAQPIAIGNEPASAAAG